MGIDKSLTKDFPTVAINGMLYRYGRENLFGQYLVENAEYAKDYWCFDRREDLEAFLACLPESGYRDWMTRRHPDWHEVTPERRREYMDERRANFRKLAEEKWNAGKAEHFNVLRLDNEGFGWFPVYAGQRHSRNCADVEIQVREQDSPEGPQEHLIEASARTWRGEAVEGPFNIGRRQALKLASALIQAAGYVEDRLPEPPPDEEER